MLHVTCTICTFVHDTKEHEPRILKCGHTLCLKCIQILLQKDPHKFICPICRKEYKINKKDGLDQFLKNYKVLDIVEHIKPEDLDTSEGCPMHKISQDIICLSCCREICYKCAYSKSHESHETVQKGDLIREMQFKVKDIEQFIEKVPQHNDTIDNFYQTKFENISHKVAKTRQNLRTILDKHLTNLDNQIQTSFKKLQDGKPVSVESSMDGQLLISGDLFKKAHAAVGEFTATPERVDSLVTLKDIDLDKIKSSLDNGLKTTEIKQYLDKIEEKLFNEFQKALQEGIQAAAETKPKDKNIYYHMKFNKLMRQLQFSSGSKYFSTNFFGDRIWKQLVYSRKLHLEFIDSLIPQNFQNEFLDVFWHKNNIQAVTIFLSNQAPINEVMTTLRHFPSLFDIRLFKFYAPGCTNFDYNDCDDLAKTIKLMRLKTLEIEITNSGYIDCQSLADVLQNFKRLRTLSLGFDGCLGITIRALQTFCVNISECDYLSELKLSLKDCIIQPDFFKYLGDSLSNLSRMLNLQLTFSKSVIDDTEFRGLVTAISQLPMLKLLKLSFTECPRLSNESLGFLAGALEKLVVLETVEFVFMGCEYITEEGLKEFVDSLVDFQLAGHKLLPHRLNAETKTVDNKVLNLVEDEIVMKKPEVQESPMEEAKLDGHIFESEDSEQEDDEEVFSEMMIEEPVKEERQEATKITRTKTVNISTKKPDIILID